MLPVLCGPSGLILSGGAVWRGSSVLSLSGGVGLQATKRAHNKKKVTAHKLDRTSN